MKIARNIMIGAVIGAAVSLLDRETRHSLKEVWVQRGKLIRQLPERIHECHESIGQLAEDVVYTAEKIKEVAEKTPEMIEWVKESYDAIKHKDLRLKK